MTTPNNPKPRLPGVGDTIILKLPACDAPLDRFNGQPVVITEVENGWGKYPSAMAMVTMPNGRH